MGRFCEDEAIRMINMKLSCCPIKFADLMTSSNNSLHKIIIYMSISDIYIYISDIQPGASGYQPQFGTPQNGVVFASLNFKIL